jgi:hypothetical protein
MENPKKSYPTPPPSYFHRLVKPSNRPYVYMGDLNEDLYEPLIFEKYGDVKRTCKKTHFIIYDWDSNKTKVELKTRNNNHNTYPTTMIGFNKVMNWGKDETDKKYFFLFGFLDGLYEWELTQENYDAIGGEDAVRWDDDFEYGASFTTFNNKKKHLYIPVDKLIKISDIGCIIPDDLKHKTKR